MSNRKQLIVKSKPALRVAENKLAKTCRVAKRLTEKYKEDPHYLSVEVAQDKEGPHIRLYAAAVPATPVHIEDGIRVHVYCRHVFDVGSRQPQPVDFWEKHGDMNVA